MLSILEREVKNYLKNPLFWIGALIVVLGVFQNVRPYLGIHYLAEGEEIVNDYPDSFRSAEVYEGYVPSTEEQRMELWREKIRDTLITAFEMDMAEADAVIEEMTERSMLDGASGITADSGGTGGGNGMDIPAACEYLEKEYRFYGAYSSYVDSAYHKGTREEINAYIADNLQDKTFSYYFSRKFADFAGLFMVLFASVMLSALFFQDTRKNTYELLHTKPVSAAGYVGGKIGGGFAGCLMVLAILNLVFWLLCSMAVKDSGFQVRLSDFLWAACLYILPSMLMIVSVYSLVSLLFKSPLPAVPFLFLYIVYSNMGSRNEQGIYGYYGRPLAIMVRFPGDFFDASPPPMVLLNQGFLVLASIGIILVSIQVWKRRRVY